MSDIEKGQPRNTVNTDNLDIEIGLDFNLRAYQENINEFIRSIIKELENKNRKKLARKLASSKIIVSFIDSGSKRKGKNVLYNKVSTQRENIKGYKETIQLLKNDLFLKLKKLYLKIEFF